MSLRVFALGPGEVARFLEAGDALADRDPRRIPPIRTAIAAELEEGRSAFPGPVRLFLCERAGAPAVRVAALVHPRLRDPSGAPVGQLGYFEAADDPEAARAVLDAASEWLGGRGAREAWGPIDGGSHRPHRLMTRGFERAPFLFEPRNPPFHPALFAAAGFERLHRWRSYDLDGPAAAAALEAALARGAARARAQGMSIEGVPAARAIERLTPLVNATWAGHTGFPPLGPAEFAEAFGPLLPIVDERHVAIVRDGAGAEVGFGLTYPDRAAEVRALAGDGSGWSRLKPASAPCDRLVLHSAAVLPAARRGPAAFLLVEWGLGRIREVGYRSAVVALVTESWRTFGRALEPVREYALYRRAIR